MAESSRGLTAEQVAASRAEHGANALAPPSRPPWWREYLEKFDDPIIRILMIAAGIATVVGAFDGKVAEGVGILAAIFLATFLAFWNERRAAREFDLLNTTSDDVPVKVLRDGSYRHVPRRDIVVGDCVILEVGEEVPADGELVEAVGLLVNEAKLTGEAMPAEKSVASRLSRGTTVVDGYGLFTVSAVGDRTEIGRTLIESIEHAAADTPLSRQLAKLSQIIGVVGFVIAVTIFYALLGHGLSAGSIQLRPSEWFFLAALGVSLSVGLVNIWLPIVFDALRLLGFQVPGPSWFGGKSWFVSLVIGAVLFAILIGIGISLDALPTSPGDWLDRADAHQLLRNFMISVTIIVVAVPEGLAMSVTLSLAYSMRKMTANNLLVRRMAACETIGAVTVICSDKTGTLTMNEMRVVETRFGDAPRKRIVEALAANSTAHLSREAGQPAKSVGNPTEGSLLLWLEEQHVNYLAVRDAFPTQMQWTFNTERKFMATLGPVLHVKGAPEIVLGFSESIATANGSRPLTDDDRKQLQESSEQFQSRGMRTLAFAYRVELPIGQELDSLTTHMIWLGFVAIADPVRPEVPAAIAACRKAGVQVKIVTGDSVETAREIGRLVGLGDAAEPLTGPEFAALSDEKASEAAATLAILARARPADKLRLVRLLKARGEVVAVTGDGVNDGPALNYADVGLAMGRTGTAVAREASDIILLDDSFPNIVCAVRWGRSLYENIQRFILFQLTINVVALGLAVLGPFLGYEMPLTVLQMLWVNLIMDTFAALALATEPPNEAVLDRPPRSPKAFIVTPRMAREIFGAGAALLALLVGLILLWQSKGQLPGDDAPSRAGTMLFTVFVLLQFWNLFNAKALGRRGSVLPTLGNNPSFLAIAAAILLGQILLVQFGGAVFRTVPLSAAEWLVLLFVTSFVLWLGEARRSRC
jgi:Ca2+-transporting ATPase